MLIFADRTGTDPAAAGLRKDAWLRPVQSDPSGPAALWAFWDRCGVAPSRRPRGTFSLELNPGSPLRWGMAEQTSLGIIAGP